MRVVVVGPVYPYRGGISQFTTSLAYELSQAGDQVMVISFARQYPAFLYPGASDKDPSAEHEEVEARYLLDPLYPWTWGKALREIQSFRPDLVLMQWWTTFWAPAFFSMSTALKRAGVHCAFCIHNVIPHENRAPDRWLARGVLGSARSLMTLSPKETRRLAQLLPHARVYESRLPVPRGKAPALDQAARGVARSALHLGADERVLLFFGIVRPYKGLSVLIDALNILQAEGKPCRLLVVGEFWDDLARYEKQIQRLGLAEQIRIENRYVPNEDLVNYFASADAFVAPYMQGTQSAAIKTAMSYRLPVLASDQIAGDLPSGSYPVSIHKAGNAEDLARSIRAYFEHGLDMTGAGGEPQDDWYQVVSLVERIANGAG